MHNLISYNQLSAWKSLDKTLDRFIDEHETINSYFECLSECDDKSQFCKRICRSLLSQ
jgi:uncharacterized protein YggL (DUF469 family)